MTKVPMAAEQERAAALLEAEAATKKQEADRSTQIAGTQKQDAITPGKESPARCRPFVFRALIGTLHLFVEYKSENQDQHQQTRDSTLFARSS